MTEPAQYRRIVPLPEAFTDIEARAVEALAVDWRQRYDTLRGSPELNRFNEQLQRRWAIETGILERLYDIERGTTQLLVERGLDIALIEHGSTDRPASEVIAILRDHTDAAEYVVDFVAGKHDISLHFIRSLHQLLTRNQSMVDALDQFGKPIQVPLTRGAWKDRPNNPVRPDGALHVYCPPELVEEEMQSLLGLYVKSAERGTPAAILSAWLHHRFTQVHPFQDGNGRVARALSAFVFLRQGLFPIVVDRDQRAHYIDCLEAADDGDLVPLVRLWSRLQSQEIERALLLSATELPADEDRLRVHLLADIQNRVRTATVVPAPVALAVTERADAVYQDVLSPALGRLRADMALALADADPAYSFEELGPGDQSTLRLSPSLWLATEPRDYDLNSAIYHRFTALRISRSIYGQHHAFDIVLSLHGIGQPFSGLIALDGYCKNAVIDNRSDAGQNRVESLSERHLTISGHEAPDDIKLRCQAWVDTALNVALETFRRSM